MRVEGLGLRVEGLGFRVVMCRVISGPVILTTPCGYFYPCASQKTLQLHPNRGLPARAADAHLSGAPQLGPVGSGFGV